MTFYDSKPLVVQRDLTVLLDVRHAHAENVRSELATISDLVKSPHPIHMYRISSLSLWNAAASGKSCEKVIRFLQEHSKTALPNEVIQHISKVMQKYGLIRLESHGKSLRLVIDSREAFQELSKNKTIQSYLKDQLGSQTFAVSWHTRGLLKQAFIQAGYPVMDLAGYQQGEPMEVEMKQENSTGIFKLRPYQREAVQAFFGMNGKMGGDGLLVLPCGAGKTIIGIQAMATIKKACLILTSNGTSVRQWKKEIVDKTTLKPEQIGEYTKDRKQVRSVTIATYQILTWRKSKNAPFIHLDLFKQKEWGLIIYDEVHLLPAPVFRATAHIQAARRLGLTATLVREDGREADVFSLVGPKRYDMPWKTLEQQGWIANVSCEEIRVPLAMERHIEYMNATSREKLRIAGENPAKLDVVERLLKQHHSDNQPVLIIGQFLDQLHQFAKRFQAPMISGQMSQRERDHWYDAFKKGEVPILVVSKVANFAIDLPDASLAIQVSGSFGSRQEEAQRIGRILRPKTGDNRAWFYTIVSANTKEQDFAGKRQMFLLEQGYRYRVRTVEECVSG